MAEDPGTFRPGRMSPLVQTSESAPEDLRRTGGAGYIDSVTCSVTGD